MAMDEYWAAPPALDEVVRELDPDTEHIGSPTRSPRSRTEWTVDSYHFPSHARKWLTFEERGGLVEACANVDPDHKGRIPVAAIGKILAAVGAQGMVGRAERSLPREKQAGGRMEIGDSEEFVSFLSIVEFVAESNRLVRSPFGGKRCIVNRLPLPPCCTNGHCVAHMEKPTAVALTDAANDDLENAALKIVFAQHDADGSGGLEMEELPKILDEYGVEYNQQRLSDVFNIYDVDRSGTLDFEEFKALLKDMDADKTVAQKRMVTYDLPSSLLKEFSKEAIEEMRMTFGLFDESGDGALDEEELEGILRTFGQEPTKEKIHEEMVRIDYDRSGTIDFQEFVTLMKKIRDGEVELDDSAFGRAVMNSATATRLHQELHNIACSPIAWVTSAKLVKSSPATLEARIVCPEGTPYEGHTMTLELVAYDGYPFIAPVARFLERVFHLNFTILLDGSTAMRPLLDQWTAAWDVKRLLQEVVQLLIEPDPSLLPYDLKRLSATTSKSIATSGQPPSFDGPTNNSTEREVSLHESSSTTVVGASNGGGAGVRGDDLREKKRSALVTARVAGLWYDDRSLYEGTARKVAQGQHKKAR